VPVNPVNGKYHGKVVKKVTVGGNELEDLKDTAQILYLPCHKLLDHPLHFDFYLQSHLDGLVSSIRETGLLEPIVVSAKGEAYRILSGHYRIRAVRRLKWKQVLCRVVKCDDRRGAVIYCNSNLLTRDLSVIEEAYMISGMISLENFTMTEIGKLFGRSKSWVSRRLGLLTRLDVKMKKEIEQGFLHPRLAQELARLPRGNDQARVLKLIRREHMGKDAAAELISWWLNAGEAERKMVEQKGFLKNTQEIFSSELLAKHVGKHLSDCTLRLTRIVSIVKGQKVNNWWPQATYHLFKTITAELDTALREQNLLQER
jgi:ParB/RepB/Spo0J family partition protein